MKSVCLVHPGRAQLPELKVYQHYLSDSYQVTEQDHPNALEGYDIVWFFMGLYLYKPRKDQFIVHEYASLSRPPFAKLKDQIKRYAMPRPDLRVFQNPFQAQCLAFRDDVPVRFRDMGVTSAFVYKADTEKDTDIIYIGAMDNTRQLEKSIDILLKLKPTARIKLVGIAQPYLVQRYRQFPNIVFTGKVDYADIPALLQKAHFGLNYVPDIYPYRLQASTKLLEYIACGLPVIGNINLWVASFLKDKNINYLDINKLQAWPDSRDYIQSPEPELIASLNWSNVIANADFGTILPK